MSCTMVQARYMPASNMAKPSLMPASPPGTARLAMAILPTISTITSALLPPRALMSLKASTAACTLTPVPLATSSSSSGRALGCVP